MTHEFMTPLQHSLEYVFLSLGYLLLVHPRQHLDALLQLHALRIYVNCWHVEYFLYACTQLHQLQVEITRAACAR